MDVQQDVQLPNGLVREATYSKGTAVICCAFSISGTTKRQMIEIRNDKPYNKCQQRKATSDEIVLRQKKF